MRFYHSNIQLVISQICEKCVVILHDGPHLFLNKLVKDWIDILNFVGIHLWVQLVAHQIVAGCFRINLVEIDFEGVKEIGIALFNCAIDPIINVVKLINIKLTVVRLIEYNL